MRFWAEHPEDAEHAARDGNWNEAFFNHPDAQKAIRAMTFALFREEQRKKAEQESAQEKEEKR